MNPLDNVRQEIDDINKQMLELFLKRMKCSEEVARIKIANNTPVFNAQRENEILEEMRVKGGEMGNHAVGFFSALMAVSKHRQQEMVAEVGSPYDELISQSGSHLPEHATVFCQGVEGAYSHKASKHMFPDGNINFLSKFEDVFKTVESNSESFGVIPVENSLAGSVTDVYKLIIKYRLYIVAVHKLGVSHCIASKNSGDLISKVVSHPQALMQCEDYIEKNSYHKHEFSNTAAAAKFVSESDENGIAAICSEEAAEKYGLYIHEKEIQDDKTNFTRFVVISKKPIFEETANKISLCFSIPNETGSLYRILERFAVSGLNLSKIESCPLKGKSFEYDFFLDFKGSIKDKAIALLLHQLENELPRYSFLGNYTED